MICNINYNLTHPLFTRRLSHQQEPILSLSKRFVRLMLADFINTTASRCVRARMEVFQVWGREARKETTETKERAKTAECLRALCGWRLARRAQLICTQLKIAFTQLAARDPYNGRAKEAERSEIDRVQPAEASISAYLLASATGERERRRRSRQITRNVRTVVAATV